MFGRGVLWIHIHSVTPRDTSRSHIDPGAATNDPATHRVVDIDTLTLDEVTVGIDWWAKFYGLSVWYVRGMVLKGTDPRIPPPLDIPGRDYRWRKSDVIAFVGNIPTVKAGG